MNIIKILKKIIISFFLLFTIICLYPDDLTGGSSSKVTDKSIKELESEFDIKSNNKEKEINANDYISVFENDKNYFQAGAFKIKNNAERLFKNINEKKFNKKLFIDSDGLYKVLIIASSGDKEILNKIRDNIASDVFLKKRAK